MKCLPEYQERAINLLTNVFSELSLEDRGHIQEIVGRDFAWTEHAAQSEGYNLPTSLAFAHLSKAGACNEMVSGLTNYRSAKELAQNYPKLEEEFLKNLQKMASIVFNRNNLIFSITAIPHRAPIR